MAIIKRFFETATHLCVAGIDVGQAINVENLEILAKRKTVGLKKPNTK